MKKLEIILGSIALIAMVLKFFMIPGSAFLGITSLSILAVLYFCLGLVLFNGIRLRNLFKKDPFEGISGIRIAGAILSGFYLSIVCVGILFTFESWPGANLMMIQGLTCLTMALVVVLIRYYKNKSEFSLRIIKRIAIIGGFAFLMVITPETAFVRLKFRNHPQYIEAFEAYARDPNNPELILREDIEYHRAVMPKEMFDEYLQYSKEHPKRKRQR